MPERTIVITGASGGIGTAAARRCLGQERWVESFAVPCLDKAAVAVLDIPAMPPQPEGVDEMMTLKTPSAGASAVEPADAASESGKAVPPTPLAFEPVRLQFTPEERAARGRANRKETPRRSQAAWEPWPSRPDPVSLLEEQATTRDPGLVPIRYGRMLTSPFAFFRGAAYVMASDLATTPRTGIKVQACGDAHLDNFGIYASPDRSLIFDLNDFDETLPGPWEWDLKRLAASFEVAMRQRGVESQARRDVLLGAVRTYRETMAEFARMGNLDVWYARLDSKTLSAQLAAEGESKQLKTLTAAVEKAQSKNNLRALDKLTVTVDGAPRIVSQPPLVVPAVELLRGEELERFEATVRAILSSYAASLPDDRRYLLEQYEFRQIARKVVGVGSVGLRAWIVLMVGRDRSDPLFLQLKQAEASVLERFVGRSRYRSHGRRVVEGQRLTQAASDIFLGWYKVVMFDGKLRDFYVRQLWDGKASVDVTTISLSVLAPYAAMCGWTLAKGHARTGDCIAISAYLGTGDVFENAIADFAGAYADQNERDFETLHAAVKSGRIRAEMGV